MAREYCNFRPLIFVLLALIQFWSHKVAEGGISAVKKTIKSSDGDIIDCVDIYKQPAFNSSPLKNHKIQLKLNSYARGLEARNSSTELFQSWHENGECPLGTIPILRTPKIFSSGPFAAPIPQRNGWFNKSSASSNDSPYFEFAIVSLPDGNYIGARGTFNLWSPKVADNPSEFSLCQMWVRSGLGGAFNAIQTGWQVFSDDNNARSFIYWTRDGYEQTGCYNLACPGFVQISPKIALGAIIKPLSTYDGQQFDIKLTIKKDLKTGDWVFLWGEEYVGYWPKAIFTSLANSATSASFGGEVSNTKPGGHHTTTQMGSGHFPSEGYGKAAYIAHIGYIDNGNVFKDANNLTPLVTVPSCYNISILNSPQLGAHIYFGGPGISPNCP